jgi:hypothetical protein
VCVYIYIYIYTHRDTGRDRFQTKRGGREEKGDTHTHIQKVCVFVGGYAYGVCISI